MIEQRPFTQHQMENYCGAATTAEAASSVLDEGEEGDAILQCNGERSDRGKAVFSHFHMENRNVCLCGEGSHGAET